MNRWLTLDSDKLAESRRKTINGVNVEVTTSPYDIPVRVMGSYEKDAKKFAITFDYLTNDKQTDEVLGPTHVSLVVGRESRRIYKIYIDVDKFSAEQVTLALKTVDSLNQDLASIANAETEIPRKVISRNRNELFSELSSV